MDKVKLYTKDGGFVVEIDVLPFQVMPDAIMWGQRVFIRNQHGEYREGFMWFHVSISDGAR